MNNPTNPPDDEVTDVDVGEVTRWDYTIAYNPIAQEDQANWFKSPDGFHVEYKDHARIVADLRARVEELEERLARKEAFAIRFAREADEVSRRCAKSEKERDAALARLAAAEAETEALRRELERERAKREAWND